MDDGPSRWPRAVPHQVSHAWPPPKAACSGAILRNFYVVIWPIEQVAALNEAYAVREFAPGLVLVSTDARFPGTADNPLVGYVNVRTRDLGGRFVIRPVDPIPAEGLAGGGVEIKFVAAPKVRVGDIVVRLGR